MNKEEISDYEQHPIAQPLRPAFAIHRALGRHRSHRPDCDKCDPARTDAVEGQRIRLHGINSLPDIFLSTCRAVALAKVDSWLNVPGHGCFHFAPYSSQSIDRLRGNVSAVQSWARGRSEKSRPICSFGR